MKLVVVIQARLGSSRLPGKIALPLAGKPLLERMLERVQAARLPDRVVVATTRLTQDDAVAGMAAEAGVPVFRGHPTDLLDRHYRAGLAHRAGAVVKIPSDCPLIDPAAIDRVLQAFLADPEGCDFCSNLHPPTWPDGNDVEVMPFPVLETAWREARMPHEREHTTPFVWDRPRRFRIRNVVLDGDRDLSRSHRFTIDYPEDYSFVREVYDALWRPGKVFGLEEILSFLNRRRDVRSLNAKFAGVNWYRDHLEDLETVGSDATRNPEDDPWI